MRLKQRRRHDAKMRRRGRRRKGAREALFLGFLLGLWTEESVKPVVVPVAVKERQVDGLLGLVGAQGAEIATAKQQERRQQKGFQISAIRPHGTSSRIGWSVRPVP